MHHSPTLTYRLLNSDSINLFCCVYKCGSLVWITTAFLKLISVPLAAVPFHHEAVSQHVNGIPLDETKSVGIIQEYNHMVQLPREM